MSVFCVEHGRWSGRGEAETTQLVDGGIRLRAGRIEFLCRSWERPRGLGWQSGQRGCIGSVGSVNRAARLAVQGDKSQQKVWQKVGEVNAKSSNDSQSGDFAGNYTDVKVVKQLEPYVKVQLPKTYRRSIADCRCHRGRRWGSETLDVFESTPLFRQLWPKLLKSYGWTTRPTLRPTTRDLRKLVSSGRQLRRVATSRTSVDLVRGDGSPRTKIDQRRSCRDDRDHGPLDHPLRKISGGK